MLTLAPYQFVTMSPTLILTLSLHDALPISLILHDGSEVRRGDSSAVGLSNHGLIQKTDGRSYALLWLPTDKIGSIHVETGSLRLADNPSSASSSIAGRLYAAPGSDGFGVAG